MLTAMNFADGSACVLLGQSFVVPMFVTNPTAEIMQYSKDYLFTVVSVLFLSGGAACLPHRDPERGQYLGTVCSLCD